MFDLDGSGELDHKELKYAIENDPVLCGFLGLDPKNPSQFNEVFAAMDKDNSGAISMAELNDRVTRFNQGRKGEAVCLSACNGSVEPAVPLIAFEGASAGMVIPALGDKQSWSRYDVRVMSQQGGVMTHAQQQQQAQILAMQQQQQTAVEQGVAAQQAAPPAFEQAVVQTQPVQQQPVAAQVVVPENKDAIQLGQVGGRCCGWSGCRIGFAWGCGRRTAGAGADQRCSTGSAASAGCSGAAHQCWTRHDRHCYSRASGG